MANIIENELKSITNEESLCIEVTTLCNGECRHCFVHTEISEESNLPIDLVKEIISEGYSVGYRNLHITGGEPLLWEGLFEVLDYTYGVGYKTISMNTNGTLLTKNISNELASYDCLDISVSLEGNEALHDQIRGMGSYKRTIYGIDRLLMAGIDPIIYATVTKSLIPALPYFANDLFKRYPNIKDLTLIQLINPVYDNTFALSDELLEPEDVIKLVQTVSLLNLFGFKTIVKNNPLAFLVSKLIEMPGVPLVHPLYREGSMIIMANRNICLSHSSVINFGKYKPGIIKKVLNSEEYRNAIGVDDSTCISCKYIGLCRENCINRPSERYLNQNSKAPYCKRVLDSATIICSYPA